MPETNEQQSPPPANSKTPAEMRAFPLWAAQKATPDWLLAAARHKADWLEGRELTEADYDKAIAAAESEVIA